MTMEELIKELREKARQRLIDRDRWNITDDWVTDEMVDILREFKDGKQGD